MYLKIIRTFPILKMINKEEGILTVALEFETMVFRY